MPTRIPPSEPVPSSDWLLQICLSCPTSSYVLMLCFQEQEAPRAPPILDLPASACERRENIAFWPPVLCSLIGAMSNSLLRIYPSELKMPFELKKQNSGCLELVNKTDQHVAFKVKTTNPRKYSVRPTSGVVPPRGSCGVTVTMQAPKEIPPDYLCKDKFLVQSIVVQSGTTQKDIAPDMFSKAPGRVVEEFKLRVVYIPANPPSPVPEEAEEEIASLDSEVNYEVKRPSMFDSASRHGYTSGSQDSYDEGVSVVDKSEAGKYVEENQKLQQELELLRKRRPSPGGFSATFALLVFTLSVLVGYLTTGSKV